MTPLGANLRVKGRVILDIGKVDERLKDFASKLPLRLKSYEDIRIEDLMELVNIDPDIADLVNLNAKNYVIGCVE